MAQQSSARRRHAGPAALIAVIMTSASACGVERPTDATDEQGLLPGLTSCGGADSPVAAFWAGDKGDGWPGGGPTSPEGGDIWVITADGAVTAITDDARSRDPSPSSDGQRLYFNRSEGGIVVGAAAPASEAWVHDVATGSEQMLFALAEPTTEHLGRLVESPDGSTIAYSAALGTLESARQRLYVVDRLRPDEPTQLPSPDIDLFTGQVEPVWHPDGTTLAYLYYEINQAQTPTWAIRLLDVKTNKDRLLYTYGEPSRMHGLDWSLDGQSLLVMEEPLEPAEQGQPVGNVVVSIDVATGARTELTDRIALDATYSDAAGTTLSAVGVPFTQLNSDSALPSLLTWHVTNGPSSESADPLPVDFAFAADLSIARCALSPAR